MKKMTGKTAVLFALWFSTSAWTNAQQSQTAKALAPKTAQTAGELLFNTYCAVCHGKDAKGNGPAAAALKVKPADLTMLAHNHGGKYPTDYVATVLRDGLQDVKAHGSKDMPIWGDLFGPPSALSREPARQVQEENDVDTAVVKKIRDLNRYIESLQQK